MRAGPAVGGLIAYAGLRTMALNDLGHLVAFTLLGAFVAVQSSLRGDLAKELPDCDPCGLVGSAARLAIVVVMALPIVGGAGVIAGWAGAAARSRSRGRPALT